MCGIIGIVGKSNVDSLLIEGLKKLEYRGYDSSGIAVIENNDFNILKEKGKIKELEKLQLKNPSLSSIGIGHTRWATHGKVTVDNAHPHFSDKVALVHNGIIENYQELRNELEGKGYVFQTETDTESIVWLITDFMNQGFTPYHSVKNAIARLDGSFALAILFKEYDNLIIGARRGSPLAVGYGEECMFIGSDAIALSPFTDTICYLNDGDVVQLTSEKILIEDEHGRLVSRKIKKIEGLNQSSSKGDFDHYMLKEIFEQPSVIQDNIQRLFYDNKPIDINLSSVRKVTMIACGTSYYAALVGKYWLEKFCPVDIETDVASEFRYRTPYMEENNIALFLSQSGETADTLAALRYCKQRGQKIVSIINVPDSTIARESDHVIYMNAGVEIGVASTKAFVAQLLSLIHFIIELSKSKSSISSSCVADILKSLEDAPKLIESILSQRELIKTIATEVKDSKSFLYLGRGVSYPIAMEGALKIKEISYISAESYAAGEMKHGPIALIDEQVPVIVIAPYNHLFEKTASNIAEVKARHGKVILITDEKGKACLCDQVDHIIEIPSSDFFVEPILSVVPIQLLAYYVALLKGNDVDMPRNLAKSVTVE